MNDMPRVEASLEMTRMPDDPILTEVVRNGVIAVTEEMKTNLMRTAYNLIIYESLDFTTGLFTADGETVSIGLGLPMFTRGMAFTVRAMLDRYGKEGIEPGDILITNDAYITGSHLNHVTLAMPIFHDGMLVGFAVCMAHWISIGGVMHGMTTDIYAEGIQIPVLKLQKRGKINRDIVDMILMNVRIPERAHGDLRAQITAVTTGERRFLELINRHGRDQVLRSIEHLMNSAERSARARTQTIPDGIYEAESFVDDDGLDVGKRIPIKVRVVVAGDRMTVDLSGVAPQVRGFFNSGPSTGLACAQVAYKCLTSPEDWPINDGSFRSLEVVLPAGRIVSAERPAPMRLWMQYPMTIIDTIFKALAPAIPERVMAGHHASLILIHITGMHPRDRKLFIGTLGHSGGGWGAKMTEDGVSATVAMNDGDTHSTPVEMSELKYPFLFQKFSLIPDSGGAGKYRGGLGVERSIQALSEITISSHVERTQCAPWGLAGGLPGLSNQVTLSVGDRLVENPTNAKLLGKRLRQGDRLVARGGGGGGFGSPWHRRVERVRDDVVQGYVTVDAAKDLYGVVFRTGTHEVDLIETQRQRAALAERSQFRQNESMQ